jgi:hypothetical protein
MAIKNKNIAPDAAIDSSKLATNVVTATSTSTLTNKTLTAPTITAPVISGAMTVADGATLTTPNMTINVQAVAAAGSEQGDAGAITETGPAFIHATAADGNKGVRLPAAAAGQILFIKNSDAANAVLKVYPATDDAINALSANASLDMAAKTSAVLIALDATTWYSIPLLPS